MKKVIIEGKEYHQIEQSDIDRLPAQNHPKDMLTDIFIYRPDNYPGPIAIDAAVKNND